MNQVVNMTLDFRNLCLDRDNLKWMIPKQIVFFFTFAEQYSVCVTTCWNCCWVASIACWSIFGNISKFKWEVLPHPTYSQDLVLSDYHLFASMGHVLAEQHFKTFNEVQNWFEAKQKKFYQAGIRKFAWKSVKMYWKRVNLLWIRYF